MDDETTTNGSAPQAQVETPAQPTEVVDTPAAVEPPETPADPSDEPATPAQVEDGNTDDFDFNAWLEKKGIDPATPEGREQIAKSWRGMEQKMHKTTQQASEFEKQVNAQPINVDTDNALLQQMAEEQANLKTALAIRDWKTANNITDEQDQKLGEYVTANQDKAWLYKNGYLSLNDLYAMSGIGKIDTSSVKQQGKQEALEQLANKQRATAVASAAASPAAPSAGFDPIAAALAD